MQSPIDIQPGEAVTFEKLDKFTVKLEALSGYDPTQNFELTNTGHSGLCCTTWNCVSRKVKTYTHSLFINIAVQVNLPDNAWGLTLNKDEPGRYRVAQFHFHWPSEHVVSGKHFDMEVRKFEMTC